MSKKRRNKRRAERAAKNPTVTDGIKKLKEEKRLDGFENEITGWGGANDSISNTDFFRPKELSRNALNNRYDFNWLSKRVVDAPVDDMISNWISFLQTNDDEDNNAENIEALKDDIQDIEMPKHLIEAFKQSRLHRGSLIYFDFGDDSELPLSRDPLPGELQRIEVVNSWYAFPSTDFNFEIHGNTSKIGQPEHYHLTIFHDIGSENIDVHESRVIRIKGLPVSSREESARRLGWGFSVLEAFDEASKHYGVAMQASADILQKFFYITLKIGDLAQLIENSEDETVIKRAQWAVNTLQSQNVGVFGEDEELSREHASVSGIPDITDRLTNQVCAAAHPGIPYSVLFSAEGGVLAGTSAERDIKNYYKRIGNMQNNNLRPVINKFLFYIGYDFKDFPYIFNPIDDLSQKEQLENFALWIEAVSKAVELGILLPEEVTFSTFGQDEIKLLQIAINEELRNRVEKEREEREEEFESGEDGQSGHNSDHNSEHGSGHKDKTGDKE